MVHRGFMHAYTHNGFNERLLAKVEYIVNRCQSAQLEGGGAAEVQASWGCRLVRAAAWYRTVRNLHSASPRRST